MGGEGVAGVGVGVGVDWSHIDDNDGGRRRRTAVGKWWGINLEGRNWSRKRTD